MLKIFLGRNWWSHQGNVTRSSEFERRNPRRGKRGVTGGLSGAKAEWEIEASCMDKKGPSNVKCHRTTQAHGLLLLRICTDSSPGFLFPATHPSSPNLLIFSSAAIEGNGSPSHHWKYTDRQTAGRCWVVMQPIDSEAFLDISQTPACENLSVEGDSSSPTPAPGSSVSGEGGTPCLSSHSVEAFLGFVTYIPLTTLLPHSNTFLARGGTDAGVTLAKNKSKRGKGKKPFYDKHLSKNFISWMDLAAKEQLLSLWLFFLLSLL